MIYTSKQVSKTFVYHVLVFKRTRAQSNLSDMTSYYRFLIITFLDSTVYEILYLTVTWF